MLENKRRGLLRRWLKAFGFFQAEQKVYAESGGLKSFAGWVRQWFVSHAPEPQYDPSYRARWRLWFQQSRKMQRIRRAYGLFPSDLPMSAVGRGFPRPTTIEAERMRMAARTPVQLMTNWQRNQWAAAGYPGMRDPKQEGAERFAMMVHPKTWARWARLSAAPGVVA
jgi:hypothetical protein